MTAQQQEIHDQIGKLKTDLFKCIGTIESIQSKCHSRQAPSPEKCAYPEDCISPADCPETRKASDQARNQTLDELKAKLVATWEEAKDNDDPEWEETHSFSLVYLKKEIESLRNGAHK